MVAACYGNRLGRKNTLRTGAVISALGAVLQFSAYSFPQLIVGRVINGVGNGMFPCQVSVPKHSLTLLYRSDQLHLRGLPGRILPKRSPGEAIGDCGPPQCGVLLCCNLVDIGVFIPSGWISVETTFGFTGEHRPSHSQDDALSACTS